MRPTFGSAPAPSPLVSFAPICSLTGAALFCSACRSVLATMNSTPSRPARTMRLTALPPPPPTPITLMRAPARASSSRRSRSRSSSSASSASVRVVGSRPSVMLPCELPAVGAVRASRASEEFSEQAAQPARHAHQRAGARPAPAPARSAMFRCPYSTSPTAVANVGLFT